MQKQLIFDCPQHDSSCQMWTVYIKPK